MGLKAWIAEVIGFERSGPRETVQVDPGGGANKTADHFAPSGIDAPPLPGDFAAGTGSSGAGTAQVTGYSDPNNTRKALGGEVRLYARDANGVQVAEIWAKRDGTVETTNAGGTISMSPAGIFTADTREVRLTDAAGQPLARVGDLVSVVIPPLVVIDPGGPGTFPISVGAGLDIPAAGQIISGNNNILG